MSALAQLGLYSGHLSVLAAERPGCSHAQGAEQPVMIHSSGPQGDRCFGQIVGAIFAEGTSGRMHGGRAPAACGGSSTGWRGGVEECGGGGAPLAMRAQTRSGLGCMPPNGTPFKAETGGSSGLNRGRPARGRRRPARYPLADRSVYTLKARGEWTRRHSVCTGDAQPVVFTRIRCGARAVTTERVYTATTAR